MSDVFNAIANTISLSRESDDMAKHVSGFVRSDRGSYVEGLETLGKTVSFLYDMSAKFEEVTHEEVNAECPGAARMPARYFRASLPSDFTAWEGVALIADIAEAGRLDEVRVRMGPHGPEFYVQAEINTGSCISAKKTDVVWIILGPSDDGEVVWTWYPGRMTAGNALDNHAVKLVS